MPSKPIYERGTGKKVFGNVKMVDDPDAAMIAKTGSYELYANPKQNKAYVRTANYHAGVLVIEREGITALLKEVFPEKKKQLEELLEETKK